jgi:C4-type Zn-finger protein
MPLREKIMECVTQLSALLDMGSPFTWVVHDPSGLSTFRWVHEVLIS